MALIHPNLSLFFLFTASATQSTITHLIPQPLSTTHKEHFHNMASKNPAPADEPAPPPGRPSMAFRQLKYLPITLLLASTGVVAATDIAFFAFSFFYALFLSNYAFPPAPSSRQGPLFGANNKALARYVTAATVVSLILPGAYMVEGVAGGDWAGIRAAGPHVFLLAAQIFMEGMTFYLGLSMPAWVFVPVCYNSRRLFSIADWLAAEFSPSPAAGRAAWRVVGGRGLAVANMGFWSFNLFGFLVPVVLPRVLKRYYGTPATP